MADTKTAKSQELVKHISDGVLAAFEKGPEKRTQEKLAVLDATLCAILAKLDAAEVLNSSGATKRETKGTKKAGTKKAAKAVDEGDAKSKVKNSMLYCRWAWANDEEFRNTYETPEIRASLDEDTTIAKKTSGSPDRLLAEGTAVWKQYLNEEQKAEIKSRFASWKSDITPAEPQLDADADADAPADE